VNQALISPADLVPGPDIGRAPIRHLYAHIPFCPTKCDYCAFVTHVGSDKLIAPYVSALSAEASARAATVGGGPLDTIYLGGGTPSMLSPPQISNVLNSFSDCFGIASGAEITIEAHPRTVNPDKLGGYLDAGVNRISFGVESLARAELSALGRFGGDLEPLAALEDARTAGFHSIAADLMYGIPLQTPASWAETLRRLLLFGPDHLSLYPLSIEPKTVFHRRRRHFDLAVPSDDQVVEMYHMACDTLSAAGYTHYEVGSWCLDGHESRHNLAYWRNHEFFGLGVGAHGYVRSRRSVNMRQTSRYIGVVQAGGDPTREVEEIDAETRRVETIMLSLRLLSEGLSIDQVQEEHGWDMRERRGAELNALSNAGLIRVDRHRVFLSESAVPVANEVWERLAF
jgi:oxygen-independent coproporphyrinogen-3 oxidase